MGLIAILGDQIHKFAVEIYEMRQGANVCTSFFSKKALTI